MLCSLVTLWKTMAVLSSPFKTQVYVNSQTNAPIASSVSYAMNDLTSTLHTMTVVNDPSYIDCFSNNNVASHIVVDTKLSFEFLSDVSEEESEVSSNSRKLLGITVMRKPWFTYGMNHNPSYSLNPRHSHAKNDKNAKNVHAKNSHAKNSHAKNVHAKNAHAKNVHAKNSHAKNAHDKNAHAKNVHAKNVHAKNVHAKNAHAKNVHAKNAHAKNVHAKNVHAKNAHAKNAHAKNAHAHVKKNKPSTVVFKIVDLRQEVAKLQKEIHDKKVRLAKIAKTKALLAKISKIAKTKALLANNAKTKALLANNAKAVKPHSSKRAPSSVKKNRSAKVNSVKKNRSAKVNSKLSKKDVSRVVNQLGPKQCICRA